MQYYPKAIPAVNPGAAQDSEAIRMGRDLAEKLKTMQGHNSTNISARRCI